MTTLRSIKEKGVKFTVEYFEDGEITVFALTDSCEEDCYKLIDGKFMVVLRGSLPEVELSLSKMKTIQYFLDTERVGVTKIRRGELTCDICGGEIRGDPLTVKRARKIYYACCRTCQSHLERGPRSQK